MCLTLNMFSTNIPFIIMSVRCRRRPRRRRPPAREIGGNKCIHSYLYLSLSLYIYIYIYVYIPPPGAFAPPCSGSSGGADVERQERGQAKTPDDESLMLLLLLLLLLFVLLLLSVLWLLILWSLVASLLLLSNIYYCCLLYLSCCYLLVVCVCVCVCVCLLACLVVFVRASRICSSRTLWDPGPQTANLWVYNVVLFW